MWRQSLLTVFVSDHRNSALGARFERPLKTGTTIAGVVFKASPTQTAALVSFMRQPNVLLTGVVKPLCITAVVL